MVLLQGLVPRMALWGKRMKNVPAEVKIFVA
jgi:hypothetical protein